MYPLLFPEIRATMSSTGGDGEMEMDKRVNPMPNKRIKIVSWSGIVRAGSMAKRISSLIFPHLAVRFD